MSEKIKINARKNIVFLIRLVCLILIIYYLNSEHALNSSSDLVFNLAIGVLIPLLASIIISIGAFFIILIYNRTNNSSSSKKNFILGINRISTIFNVIFIVIGIMTALGINPKEFITSITIVAMAVAITFKEYLTNMISGLFIMFSNRLKLGDVIKAGEYKGVIVDITLANVVLKTEEDELIYIPNNNAFTTTFANLTAFESDHLHVVFSTPFEVEFDMSTLKSVVVEELDIYKEYLDLDEIEIKPLGIEFDRKKFKVQITGFTGGYILYKRINQHILSVVHQHIKLDRIITR